VAIINYFQSYCPICEPKCEIVKDRTIKPRIPFSALMNFEIIHSHKSLHKGNRLQQSRSNVVNRRFFKLRIV